MSSARQPKTVGNTSWQAGFGPLGLLLLLTAAFLVPFANRAVHMDDPLFM